MLINRPRLAALLSLTLACVAGVSSSADDAADRKPGGETLQALLDHTGPRLAVVLVIDQFRYDYLTRFSDLYLPAAGADGSLGGFRWLLENGALMGDARYPYIPTHTGPGHATILTGAPPSGTGIVANDWFTSTGKPMNCVDDANERTVGPVKPSTVPGAESPRNLAADTVGDMLKLSNNRKSKVVSLAVKDRGSVLLGGHNPDAAVWYDMTTGRWITTTYYTSSTLPRFAEMANEQKLTDRYARETWDYLLPKENYDRSAPEGFAGSGMIAGLSERFPRAMLPDGKSPGSEYYKALIYTPFANEFVFDSALLALKEEKLGADRDTDILTISLSTNDLIGHTFGPNSREAQDCALRTDRYLSAFLNRLAASVEGGMQNIVFVLTADHGASPVPEWVSESLQLDAGRAHPRGFISVAEKALAAEFGDDKTSGLITYSPPYLFLRHNLLAERNIDAKKARAAIAASLKGYPKLVYAFTREDLESPNAPANWIVQMARNGYYPERSGDIMFVWKPFWLGTGSPTGTTHGDPYNYDTHVPILFAGKTVRAGFYTDRCDVRDIAPTLSLILGIQPPSRSEGKVLPILK